MDFKNITYGRIHYVYVLDTSVFKRTNLDHAATNSPTVNVTLNWDHYDYDYGDGIATSGMSKFNSLTTDDSKSNSAYFTGSWKVIVLSFQ